MSTVSLSWIRMMAWCLALGHHEPQCWPTTDYASCCLLIWLLKFTALSCFHLCFQPLLMMIKHYGYLSAGSNYCQTPHIIRTLIYNKIVDHSDVVGAMLAGTASTTSPFATQHLASMDWAKTTARRDENQFNFGIWCNSYQRFDGPSSDDMIVSRVITFLFHCDVLLNSHILKLKYSPRFVFLLWFSLDELFHWGETLGAHFWAKGNCFKWGSTLRCNVLQPAKTWLLIVENMPYTF